MTLYPKLVQFTFLVIVFIGSLFAYTIAIQLGATVENRLGYTIVDSGESTTMPTSPSTCDQTSCLKRSYQSFLSDIEHCVCVFYDNIIAVCLLRSSPGGKKYLSLSPIPGLRAFALWQDSNTRRQSCGVAVSAFFVSSTRCIEKANVWMMVNTDMRLYEYDAH